MTVHVHGTISEIVATDDHRHLRDKKKRDHSNDTERTWAFDCTPECEEQIIRTQEFTSNHPGGVPLTLAETQLKDDLEAASRVETARLSRALADLANERVATGATA